MKRLFKIGAGLFIFSLIPIISWVALSAVLGDGRIANVFSLTYAMQFVWSICKLFFGSAANIRKEKEQDKNAVSNGIFWGTIISTAIFAIPMIFVDNYIKFFGQDVEFYRPFVLYSLALLLIQTLFSFIIEKFYFEDKNTKANVHLFTFNLTNFGVLILSALITKSALISICLTLAVLLVYVIVLYILNFEKFKIDFSFFKNFRYESANIVSSLAMLLIYLFGFKTAFSAGPEYLVAINIAGLCTDTQWDTIGAISTVAKVDIAKGRYNYKKELKNAYLLTIFLIITSVLMGVGLTLARNASLQIVAVYLIMQVYDMLLEPVKTILHDYTQIEYSPTLNTAISLSVKVIRTIISVTLISPYCTDIAQIISGTLLFTSMIIIRVAKYKVIDGKLVLKQKTKHE